MSFRIDEGTDFGARAARHLREDPTAWLTTVTPAGQPQPTLVWLWWDGGDQAIVYSQPEKPKLRNLTTNQHVGIHFDSDGQGGDMVVLSGRGDISGAPPSEGEWHEYVSKYESRIRRIGYSPEEFAASYSVPIRITLTGLRGH